MTPFLRGEEKRMWKLDYIYDLPLVVKIIIVIIGLDILLIAYWTSAKEKNEESDEKEKLLAEKSKCSKTE